MEYTQTQRYKSRAHNFLLYARKRSLSLSMVILYTDTYATVGGSHVLSSLCLVNSLQTQSTHECSVQDSRAHLLYAHSLSPSLVPLIQLRAGFHYLTLIFRRHSTRWKAADLVRTAVPLDRVVAVSWVGNNHRRATEHVTFIYCNRKQNTPRPERALKFVDKIFTLNNYFVKASLRTIPFLL